MTLCSYIPYSIAVRADGSIPYGQPAVVLRAARAAVRKYPKSQFLKLEDGAEFYIKRSNSRDSADKELKFNKQLPSEPLFAPQMHGRVEVSVALCPSCTPSTFTHILSYMRRLGNDVDLGLVSHLHRPMVQVCCTSC